MPQLGIKGNLPEIIRNDQNIYEGNLIYYFQIIFFHSRNLYHPYHNFRHMMHVFWLCYQACVYYKDELTPRQMRNLLIASLFHDFDHSGLFGDDDLNILRAIRGLEKHLLEKDKTDLPDISYLIKVTEYPYTISSEGMELRGLIIRDADLSQSLNPAWLQQVVLGLAKEWQKQPIEVLAMQGPFHRSFKFHTEWSQKLFPQEAVNEKIEEAKELIDLLGIKGK